MASTSAVAAVGCVVKVDGSDLTAAQMGSLLEVKVQENVMSPAVASIRMTASDAGNSHPAGQVDDSPFRIGKTLEIQMGERSANSTTSVFKGVIVAEEPVFEEGHAEITVRAYDRAHKLNRERKTRTFQQVSASDIVSRVAPDHGLTADPTSTSDVFDHVMQANETDWELLWRLALMYDYEIVVDDRLLKFRPGSTDVGTEVTLRYTEALTAFRPRVTAAAEVAKVTVRGWDPKQKQAIVGNSSAPTLRSDASAASGHARAATDAGANSNGTLVSDMGPATQSHATKIATSIMQRLASASIEAEGSSFGNPALRAGVKVQIEGVGTRFSGKYRLSSVTHVYRSAGYYTHFAISGVAARGLLDLVQPKAQREWGSQLMVGVVSDNNDPDKTGRVKVKIPALSDSDTTWWARVVSPSAGSSHGIFSMPAVNDEVIIGFENGNTMYPYVLGSLFNGRDKPVDDMVTGQASGSHGNYVANTQEKYLVNAEKEMELKGKKPILVEGKDTLKIHSEKAMTIEVKGQGDMTLDSSGGITETASQAVSIQGGTSVSIKGSSGVTVESSAQLTLKGGAGVTISGATINIG